MMQVRWISKRWLEAGAVLLAAMVWTATGAAAEPAAAEPAVAATEGAPAETPFAGTPCEADVKRHCGTVRGSQGAYLECLGFRSKRGELRQECAEYHDGIRTRRNQALVESRKVFRRVCEADIQKLCSEFADNQRAIIGCLHRQADQVSAECNKRRPKRGRYRGEGNIRWRDGSEPADFDLQEAMRNRPRKTKQMLDASQHDALRAEQAAQEEMMRKRGLVLETQDPAATAAKVANDAEAAAKSEAEAAAP